jgi:predicted nucleotidyltransferase
MLTRKALTQRITGFITDLKAAGYSPSRVVLFGSYAKGRIHEASDIDLAVWDKKFTGCGTADIEPIASIISKYPLVELHPFTEEDNELTNPFIKEILKHGIIQG